MKIQHFCRGLLPCRRVRLRLVVTTVSIACLIIMTIILNGPVVVRPSPPPCLLSRQYRLRLPRERQSDLFSDLQQYANALPHSADASLFKFVFHSLRGPWHHNKINVRYFKQLFEDKHSDMCVCNRLMLTKENAPVGLRIPMVHRNKYYYLKEKDVRKLPLNYSLPPPPYKSCSVIGSSGLLLGSKCGRAIDASDFVFRFNLAPTFLFEEDVGTKTNLTTMNPSIYTNFYGNLNGSTNLTRFRTVMRKQRGYIWTPAVGFVRNSLPMMRRVSRISGRINKNVHFVSGDPFHFKAVYSLWQRYGLQNMTSTGFYFINTALALCDNVDVFGFWPFNISADGRPVTNHYYNDLEFPKRGHDMSFEFKLILAMHHHGLLRLRVDKCEGGQTGDENT